MSRRDAEEKEAAYLAEYESRLQFETLPAPMRTVHLYGELAEAAGADELEFAVGRPCDVIRGIVSQIPEAAAAVRRHDWQILEGARALEYWELYVQRDGPAPDLHIVPVVEGEGREAGKIFGGLFLAMIAPWAAPVLGLATSTVVGLGVAVGLSGVAMVMSPVPKSGPMDEEEDPQSSFFSKASTLTQPGQPVPLVYGEALTGGLRVSSHVGNVRNFDWQTSTDLISYANLEFIDVLSEGEIDGLAGGRAGVFLNGVPVDGDGGDSDEGISVELSPGGAAPPETPSRASRVYAVNRIVLKDEPVAFVINDTTADHVRISLFWNALFTSGSTARQVNYTVDVAPSPGTAFTPALASLSQEESSASFYWTPTDPAPNTMTTTTGSVVAGYNLFYDFSTHVWFAESSSSATPSLFDVEFYYRPNGAGPWTTKAHSFTKSVWTFYHGSNVWTHTYKVKFSDVYPAGISGLEFYCDTPGGTGRPNIYMNVEKPFIGISRGRLDGRAFSGYSSDVKIYNLSQYGAGPWTVSVNRITSNLAASSTSRDQFKVQTYTTSTEASFEYPDTAAATVAGNTQELGGGSVPEISYLVRGIKCRIPSGYNAVTGAMPTIWNGAFAASRAYTTDPAWILFDLLTHPRYGLGLADSEIDLFSFGEASRRNGETVNDHEGGNQLRYTWNGAINRRDDALKVLTAVASCMDAQLWVGGGLVVLTQDRPAATGSLFNNANVEGGRFTYTGAAATARPNVARVSWRDPSRTYEARVETIERPYMQDRHGRREVEVDALGVTNLGQARRRGAYILETAERETQQVAFKIGIENALLSPGDLIAISDQHYNLGTRLAGRVVSATGLNGPIQAFVVDDPETAAPGGNTSTLNAGTFETVLGDGSLYSEVIAQITLAPAFRASILCVSTGLGGTPGAGAPFIITPSGGAAPRLFRVLSVAEDAPGVYAVSGVEHDPDKWTAIESPTEIGAPTSYPADVWPPP